jgi:proline dehydrogenase
MKLLSWVAKHAAKSYIAGADAEDAIRVCRKIAESGLRSCICPWDGPHDAPEHVATSYMEAINSIKQESLECYLSVKVPSLAYDLNLLTELALTAREYGIRIHFDSLAPDTATPSIALLEKVLTIYQNVSYTLPSRWRRSIIDAEKIIELGVPVRLIKGQWADPDETGIDAESNYLKLIDVLSGRAALVEVATHDEALARESLTRLKASGTVCELEQLYGLPLRVESVAKPLAVPVRVYVPYGHAYLSYALSSMRKRPIIMAWLLKDFLSGVKIHFQTRK